MGGGGGIDVWPVSGRRTGCNSHTHQPNGAPRPAPLGTWTRTWSSSSTRMLVPGRTSVVNRIWASSTAWTRTVTRNGLVCAAAWCSTSAAICRCRRSMPGGARQAGQCGPQRGDVDRHRRWPPTRWRVRWGIALWRCAGVGVGDRVVELHLIRENDARSRSASTRNARPGQACPAGANWAPARGSKSTMSSIGPRALGPTSRRSANASSMSRSIGVLASAAIVTRSRRPAHMALGAVGIVAPHLPVALGTHLIRIAR